MTAYDPNNIFAKILRKEAPCYLCDKRLERLRRRIENDSASKNYTDLTLSPV